MRPPLEDAVVRAGKTHLVAMVSTFSTDTAARVVGRVIELNLLHGEGEEEMSLGCGATNVFYFLCSVHGQALAQSDTETIFGGALTLLRRVCPSPLPASR